MKTLLLLGLVAFCTLFSSVKLYAQAILHPTANFTLRDQAPINGMADLMDSTPDNSGFDGFLTNDNLYQVDRVFVEFNMALLPASWNSVALRFTTTQLGSGFPPSTVRLSYYTGNGLAELSDWNTPTTTLATFPGVVGIDGQTFTVDVSSLTHSFGESGFLGVRFELLDPSLNQKSLYSSSIVLTQVPEPSPALLWLVGMGLLHRMLGSRNQLRSRCLGLSQSRKSL
jgi:hypothetical protein